MASKNSKIEKVLSTALKAWAASQSVTVAYEGKGFKTPAIPGKYVSQVLLPTKPVNVAIGSGVKQRYRGIYQIDVYSSGEDAKYEADEIVGLLEGVFVVGSPLTYNSVSVQIENFYADPHGKEEGWCRISISVFYRCEI